MQIDWKRKLTSRKLWAAIVAFVTAIMLYQGAQPGSIESIASIIMAGGSLIAYIFGEGWADAAGAQAALRPDLAGNINNPPELSKQS